MNEISQINQFLTRIQKKWNRVRFILGAYLAITFLTGVLLAVALFYYFQLTSTSYIAPIVLLLFLGKYIYSNFNSNSLNGLDRDGAALLTEKKYPKLNNSLINSVQLGEYIGDPVREKLFSSAMIRELLARTQKQLTKLDANLVLENGKTASARNLFLATMAVGIAVTLLLPNFWQQALINSKGSVSTPGITKIDEKIQSPITQGPEKNYQISDLGLTLNYPSYTRLTSRVIKPSDGSVASLPGTEVTIEGKTNEDFHKATLVVNTKDSILMEAKDRLSLKGAFMVRERGFYQFRLKDKSGAQVLLPQKYSIELEQDQTPRIVLLPANPKTGLLRLR